MRACTGPCWESSRLNHAGYPEGGEAEWLRKPVEAERILFPGGCAVTGEGAGRLTLGEGAAELEFPLKLEKKNPSNRVYGSAGLRLSLPEREDLRGINRISLWLTVWAPGLDGLFAEISLHNEGAHPIPLPGRFEGSHVVALVPGVRRRIVWEFPDLYREACTGFSLGVGLPGYHCVAAGTGRLRLEDIRLERVQPEKSRGFDMAEGRIACSHSGYTAAGEKRGVAPGNVTDFTIEDETGKTVYSGVGLPCAEGVKLDFSPFSWEGRFRLRCGENVSPFFSVGEDAFRSAGEKLISFFYTQRCGYDLPGIHPPCHLDALCKHPDGRALVVGGGWHDAADVTQGVMNTAEAVLALLTLAERPCLAEKALEEARWGLQWILRTRFGDGMRFGGNIMGIWTENRVGDGDDMSAGAQNRPYDNFLSAAACAEAAPRYREDPAFAARLEQCAREDFAFAAEEAGEPGQAPYPEFYAMAAVAGCRLYRLTEEESFLWEAEAYARKVAACQQTTPFPPLSRPLSGFFWETPEKKRILNYYHRSGEYLLTECFSLLLECGPHRPEAADWHRALEAYAGYIRAISEEMEPWGILPNGIYQVDNTDYSGLYHEGEKVGLPTLGEYNAQVRNGIPLGGDYYLRRFPVAYQFRGFFGTLLGKARAAALAAQSLGDARLLDIARRQAEYVVGLNPFGISFMFGEGEGYPPLYAAFSGQPVGAVPVGIETFENEDAPYMPMQTNCTYKEIWVHTASRMAEMAAAFWEKQP